MELLRAVGTFCWPPADREAAARQAALADLLDLPAPTAADWQATFADRFHPYGSVHLGPQGFVGGEVRDAAAGVFRALEAEPPAEPDHLGALLDALATVDANGWGPARSALLWDHVLPWALPYADRIRHDDGPHRAWAALLFDALLDAAAAVPSPGSPARAVADAPPGLLDPRTSSAADFTASLLAPVRLGAILTRDDLAVAAIELDLPGRVAERRYVLAGLLAEDPAAVMGWLARHCWRAAARTGAWPDVVADLRDFWTGRAHAAAALLHDLSTAAMAA